MTKNRKRIAKIGAAVLGICGITLGLLSFEGDLSQKEVLYINESGSNKLIFHENYYSRSNCGAIFFTPCRYDNNDVYSVIAGNEDYYGTFTTESTFVTESNMVYTIFE